MAENLTWLHLSDIHFSPKTEWRDSESRESLLVYLNSLLNEASHPKLDLIFCTGDIAFGEGRGLLLSEQYKQARDFFDRLLKVCNISKDRLFIVPGNHDVNRALVNIDAQNALTALSKQAASHIDLINQRFNDKSLEFKDAIKRLDSYGDFVSDYLPHQIDETGRHAYARKIKIKEIDISIAGFNSAWSAAGDEDDRHLWLAAATQFNAASSFSFAVDVRIGLIHHPVDWLNQAERQVAIPRISSDFDFWLHGHSHDAWLTPTQSNITIGAGAVGAQTSTEFGLNITSLDFATSEGKTYLHTRAASGGGWKAQTIAVHAPRGIWTYSLPARIIKNARDAESIPVGEATRSVVQRASAQNSIQTETFLKNALSTALQSYCSIPRLWVEPTLSNSSETALDVEQSKQVQVSDVLFSVKNYVIVAPPQYGLTCLAKYLASEAWKAGQGLWVYVDCQIVKANKGSITTAVQVYLDQAGRALSDITCLLVDSPAADGREGVKLVKAAADLFPHVSIICLHQRTSVVDLFRDALKDIRVFDEIYLWSLKRSHIRDLVTSYSIEKHIGNEDAVTTRIVADLEALNLHRTAQNCLTLLKASEIDFDENPVNRYEVIKRILFLLFNVDSVPRYKARPDIKDCEFVLGYFCEKMIRDENYRFSRDGFLFQIQEFCKSRLLNLDVHVVFDILHANNVIVSVGSEFSFKFSYWVLYFAAQRMYHEPEFTKYVFENRRYAHYPEIIEFYTGIDRKREDALTFIISDLQSSISEVKITCGLPDDLNPYRLDIWKASPAAEQKMRDEVADGVKESNLPAEIKDQYLDHGYDRTRPYDQRIAQVFSEPAVSSMFRLTTAASRALRNSDYTSPEVKRALLNSILDAWDQASKIVLTITPLLSVEGYAEYGGTGFILGGGFSNKPAERAVQIIREVPANITTWYEDDIYSSKTLPLFAEKLFDESISDISRHELAILILRRRPSGWSKLIQKYIANVNKDSYYLLDVYVRLRSQYRYCFASNDALDEIRHLIQMAAVKHVTGIREPGIKAIEKTKISNIIPDREPGGGA